MGSVHGKVPGTDQVPWSQPGLPTAEFTRNAYFPLEAGDHDG